VVSADPLVVDFDLNSLNGRYTLVEDFYVRNHNSIPPRTDAPRLGIGGEVEKPVELTRDELERLPKCELGAVLECAGNGVGTTGLVSNGLWSGWSLADVLMLSRPNVVDAYLHLFGRDGYPRSVPLERAQRAVLATHLNGKPLTPKHGAPWRVLFPGWYGMDSVKWLERIVVSKSPLPPQGNAYLALVQGTSGKTERRTLPRVQVKSVIVDPLDRSVLPRRKIEIRGLAWSGEGGITTVEVSENGGKSWRQGHVDGPAGFEWTVWNVTLEPTQPGVIEFVCRATDDKGNVQPAQRDPGRLDGYANNWYHRVRCVVT
jgi:DMSO/TMAO reductase YedYZ molybdopterin-dependent catalytic subunit